MSQSFSESEENPAALPASVSASHDRPLLEHNPALDGLRGLAILWVVLHHAGAVPRDSHSWGGVLLSNIVMLGWVGVDLFFVLSGFLISTILIRSYGTTNWFRNFVARRALRVLPLYFFVIFVCFNLITWLPISKLDWLRELSVDQWWYWLHLANFRKIAGDLDPGLANVGWFSTYWSLSIEEHFYLAWPLALMLFGPRRLGWVACVGILLVNGTRIGIALTDLPESMIYNNTLTRIDGLLLGSLFAWLKQKVNAPFAAAGGSVRAMFILGVLAFLIPMLMGYTGGGRSTTYGKMVLYSASSICSASLVWCLIACPANTVIYRVFSSPILRSFGKYSYAIYVFNKPIIAGVAALSSQCWGRLPTLPYVVCFLFICGLCWLAGAVSWQFIESPCLKLKRLFPSRDRSNS